MLFPDSQFLRIAFVSVFAFISFAPSSAKGTEDDNIVSGKFRLITREEAAQREARNSRLLNSGSLGGTLELVKIPASLTGTGYPEWIEYQKPAGYDPYGPPCPLIVCWHGYGQSVLSVSIDSLIDEECYTRGWIFLAITGVQQNNFGYLPAQQHCTVAIDYLINTVRLNVDLNRIYMAGYSMGGIGAASYASRHMSAEEGYPVAGLILVASIHDLTDIYNQADPGGQYWLTTLLGDNPANLPFSYKQISTLFIENNTYAADASMGQNLRHNLPVFVTYAGNDTLSYGPYQNEIFVNMLNDLGAAYQLDYYPTHATPHDWLLLDVDKAFDFVEAYALGDQQTDTIAILADRDAKFYWTECVQTAADTFSKIIGEVDGMSNELHIHEAANLDGLNVDCAWTGLGDHQPLNLTFSSSSPLQQEITLSPIATEPAYIVDGTGVLHPDYSFSGGKISILRPPSALLDLKVSFESYLLALSADTQVPIGQSYASNLAGGDPYDPFILFFAFDQQETLLKEGLHLLVNPFSPATIWFLFSLGAAGDLSIPIQVPNNPDLNGTVLNQQFLTYDTALKEISNLTKTEITD